MGFHHNPEELSDELKRVGSIIHCADILCAQEEIGFSMAAQAEEFTEELLERVGITVEQLVEVRDNMGPELEDAEATLGSV